MKDLSKKLKSELISENSFLNQRIQELEKSESDRKMELDAYKTTLNDIVLRYNDLIDQSRSIILEWDTDGNILFLNNWGLELFGFSKEEIIGRNVVGTIVPPVDSKGENLVAKMNVVQKAPDEFYSSENENIRKNGESVWISWTNRGILDQDGNLVKTLSVGIDRTLQHQNEVALSRYSEELEAKVEERTLELQEMIALRTREIEELKRVEEALRKSEERFRLSMDATHDGLWDWNIQTDECYFSPGYYRMLGYDGDDFPGKSDAWKDNIHPDDRENALRTNMDCIDGRCSHFEVEFRMKARKGEWCWILGRGMCVDRNEHGQALRLIGTHTDITERKQAEEDLRKSEGKYHNLFRDASIGIFHSTFDGKFIDINPSLTKLLGYDTPEEVIRSVTNIAKQVYAVPHERETMAATVMESGGFITTENSFLRRDGSSWWGRMHLRIVKDGQGNPSHFEGFVEDITERKQVEDALIEAQTLTSAIFNSTSDMIWSVDSDNLVFLSLMTCSVITSSISGESLYRLGCVQKISFLLTNL